MIDRNKRFNQRIVEIKRHIKINGHDKLNGASQIDDNFKALESRIKYLEDDIDLLSSEISKIVASSKIFNDDDLND